MIPYSSLLSEHMKKPIYVRASTPPVGSSIMNSGFSIKAWSPCSVSSNYQVYWLSPLRRFVPIWDDIYWFLCKGGGTVMSLSSAVLRKRACRQTWYSSVSVCGIAIRVWVSLILSRRLALVNYYHKPSICMSCVQSGSRTLYSINN